MGLWIEAASAQKIEAGAHGPASIFCLAGSSGFEAEADPRDTPRSPRPAPRINLHQKSTPETNSKAVSWPFSILGTSRRAVGGRQRGVVAEGGLGFG